MPKSEGKTQPFFSLLEQSNTLYKPYQPGTLERLFTWLGNQVHNKPTLKLLVEIGVTLGVVAPAILASALIPFGGIISLISSIATGYLGYRGYRTYRQFQDGMALGAFQFKSQNLVPPNIPHPRFKSPTQTFNQIYSFTVDENFNLWYALRESRHKQPTWKPLYLFGYEPSEVDSVEIKADGPNFNCRVNGRNHRGTIFYKKLFDDDRLNGRYIVHDKVDASVSIREWFTLPFVSWLTPTYWGELLHIDPMSRWSASNSGKLRNKHQDKKGEWHTIWNCTNVREIKDNRIILYDPYVRPGSEIQIDLPPGIDIWDIGDTSSRIFILACLHRGEKNKPIILERTIDYDAIGLNPGQATTYDTRDKSKRLMPLDELKVIPCPYKHLTGNISVIQTGEDNQCQIQLETCDKEGNYGFYYKNLEDANWSFESSQHTPQFQLQQMVLTPEAKPFTCESGLMRGNRIESAIISHFTPNVIEATCLVTPSNAHTVKFNLHRTGSLIESFIHGGFQNRWFLALCPEEQTEKNIQKFGGVSFAVKCHISEDQICIKGDNINLTFKLEEEASSVLRINRDAKAPQDTRHVQATPRMKALLS